MNCQYGEPKRVFFWPDVGRQMLAKVACRAALLPFLNLKALQSQVSPLNPCFLIYFPNLSRQQAVVNLSTCYVTC